MEDKMIINPKIITIAQNAVIEYFKEGLKGELRMPPPFDSLIILIDGEPESFLTDIPVPPCLSEKVKSLHILTSLDKI